jgi:hypothetical protein
MKRRSSDRPLRDDWTLTEEQITEAVNALGLAIADDEAGRLVGLLLVLLRSVAFTDNALDRETMFIHAERALLPTLYEAEQVAHRLAEKTYKSLTSAKKGGSAR